MEWRCEWCGKPHEEDDPPCDECGHHKFEQAVEQFTASTGQATEPVWVCTECGRSHQKHSPPCSRCGNVDFEKRQPDYSDLDELGGTSYLDVLEPKYAAGYVLVAVLLGVLALGVAGVVPLPTFGGEPAPPDAPGFNASVEGLALADVEDAYVTQLNDRRRDEDAGPLVENRRLTDVATYHNKRWVDSTYGDSEPPTMDELSSNFEVPCSGARVVTSAGPTSIDGEGTDAYADEGALATDLLPGDDLNGSTLTNATYSEVGVDVHVGPDGRAFVTTVLC